MSQAAVGTTLGGTLAGTLAVSNAPASGNQAAATVVHVAQAALPYTGFAFGLYLALALALILTGILLRHFGSRRTPALEPAGPGPSRLG